MKIFHYDPKTGEYQSFSEADIDPIDGNYLLPADATFITPPIDKEFYASVFDPKTDTWDSVIDKRGVIYYLGQEERQITELNVDVPKGASLTKPEKTLAEQKQDFLARLNQEISTLFKKAVGEVSDEEKQTWPYKAEAAKSVKNKTASHYQVFLLAQEAKAKNITEEALADKILTKAEIYAKKVSLIFGFKAEHKANLDKSVTLSELKITKLLFENKLNAFSKHF